MVTFSSLFRFAALIGVVGHLNFIINHGVYASGLFVLSSIEVDIMLHDIDDLARPSSAIAEVLRSL
jgi:hypothetical protein